MLYEIVKKDFWNQSIVEWEVKRIDSRKGSYVVSKDGITRIVPSSEIGENFFESESDAKRNINIRIDANKSVLLDGLESAKPFIDQEKIKEYSGLISDIRSIFAIKWF